MNGLEEVYDGILILELRMVVRGVCDGWLYRRIIGNKYIRVVFVTEASSF